MLHVDPSQGPSREASLQDLTSLTTSLNRFNTSGTRESPITIRPEGEGRITLIMVGKVEKIINELITTETENISRDIVIFPCIEKFYLPHQKMKNEKNTDM